MIYLIVDQNFANPKSLNQAMKIITSNLGHYSSSIWDELNKANNRAVRYFGFDKHTSQEAFASYWTEKSDKFKLVEVSFRSSFAYMPEKVIEAKAQGELG